MIKNQPIIIKIKDEYCIPCAILLKMITLDELETYGFSPPRKSFEKYLNHKRVKLQTRHIPQHIEEENHIILTSLKKYKSPKKLGFTYYRLE